MSHTNLSHRRSHNILLISRLFNQREGASPFTIVLDSLEQPAKPLLREYIRRANLAKSHTIFLAFETPRTFAGVDTFVPCWNKSPTQILQTISSATTTTTAKRCLLFIDSLTSLCKASFPPSSEVNLTAFLMSLMRPSQSSPQMSISVVAVYHFDVPLSTSTAPYSPSPLSLLQYLATTVMTIHSLPTLLAAKQARERSLGPPSFGLAEQKEGVVIGFNPQARQLAALEKGIVIQLEHRRKSGRGVLEWYFLPEKPPTRLSNTGAGAFKEIISLLDDHPLFKRTEDTPPLDNQDLDSVTFELSLTARQRLERDGVVLPYFDAQKAGGGGEGGRILYDMGVEDDFDEEEDEI